MASTFDGIASTTKDRGVLYDAALKAAASTDGAEHQALRSRLTTQPVLDLLDTRAEYEKPVTTLHIAGVIKQLMDNRTPVADESLNALASNELFTSILPRQHLMIMAMVPVRPRVQGSDRPVAQALAAQGPVQARGDGRDGGQRHRAGNCALRRSHGEPGAQP